jgi:hypothetical protein
VQQPRPGPQVKVPLLHGLQVRVQPQAGQHLEARHEALQQHIPLAGPPASQQVTPLPHLGQQLGLLVSRQVTALRLHIRHTIILVEVRHTLQLQLGQQAGQQISRQVDQLLLHIQLRGQPVRVHHTLQRHRVQRRQLTQQPGQQVNLQPQHITQQQLGRHRSQQVIQPQQPGQQIDLPASQQVEQQPRRVQPPLHIQQRGQQAGLQLQHITQQHPGQHLG